MTTSTMPRFRSRALHHIRSAWVSPSPSGASLEAHFMLSG